jgi:hypothetical protein
MGNGRSLGESSESSGGWVRPLVASLVLSLVGAVLLVSGSRRYTQKAAVQPSASRSAISSRSSLKSKPDARAILAQLPLIFEPNQGQADPSVKFLAHGAGYGLFLDATGALLSIQTAHSHNGRFVRMKLVGANRAAATTGDNPLPGKSNYILGNDPGKWHSGVPQFAGVRYRGVYPGIDLVFYGNQGHMEYDFRVAPGADPSQAEMQFDGAAKLELSGGGDLILTGKDDGGLRMQAPQVYQSEGNRRKPVAGRFVLRASNRVGFEIGAYDRSRELVIDPSLNFSTYFGGSGSETSPSVAVNGNGNIYVVGTTQGSPASSFPNAATTPQTLIPSTLSLTTTSPSHIFVAEISPSTPAVLYETFIGGSGTDTSVGIGVDNGGNAYIAGNTTSPDFPTGGVPYQTAPEAKGSQCLGITCSSVFVSVLNPTGTAPLIYSSYLSGNGNDQATGMTIDLNRDIFVTGTTTSNDAPSLNPADDFPATLLPVPYQVSPASSLQFFVTKVNTAIPGVGSIAYSTYFGGAVPSPAIAVGGGIAVDSNGNIYFSGTTNFYNSGSGAYGDSGVSGDFPIVNAYQPCLDTPPPLQLLNPNPCTAPATSPYPTDAFMAKLNPNYTQTGGAPLPFSTYLGGTGSDSSTGIAVDFGAANIYLTGTTNSPDFVIPTGSQPFQLCLNNPGLTICPTTPPSSNTDAFVARMSNPAPTTTGTPADVALTYFSYLGGSGNDSGLAITVFETSVPVNDALVTGTTNSPNFPVTAGAIQSTLAAGATQNAFLAQIDTTTSTGQTSQSYVTYFGGNGLDRGTGIAVDSSFNTYLVGDTTSTNFEQENSLQPAGLNGPSDAFVAKFEPSNALSFTSVAPTVSPEGTVGEGNPVVITFTIVNEGPDPATNIFVNGTVPSTGVTFNSASAGTGTCTAPSGNAVTCQIPSLQVGALAQIAFTVTPTASGNYSATATVSNVNNTTTNVTASASFTASAFGLAPVTPSSVTVSAGLPATYAVQVYPVNGVFANNIALSCSALPTGTACNFHNSTLTLNGGSASTTLTLTTTAQPVTTLTSAGWRRSFYALWLMVPGMAVWGLGSRSKGRRSRVLGLLALCVLFALVLLQPSCSSPKTQPQVSGTPSGTYALKVTATSGSLSQSQPFQLTVNP